MGSSVHAQAAGASTETVSLGSVFAGVAVLAEQLLVVFSDVGGVEHLATESYQ